MPKKRMNVSVDEDVHRELKARDDVNVSGLVNGFLKRWLRGESKDRAAEKMRAERLEREGKEKMEEAQSLINQAEEIRDQFQEEKREREEAWKTAVEALSDELRNEMRSVPHDFDDPEPDSRMVQHYADKIGITPREFCDRFHDKRERYHDKGIGDAGRHYQ